MEYPQQHFPSFGAWLERTRGEVPLRVFAKQVGVDSGTISRTERECTGVTVATAVRICQGLSLSLSDLFEQWLGRALPRHGQCVQRQCQGILTGRDVQRWLVCILEGHRRSRELLIAALNHVVLHSGLLVTPFPSQTRLFSLADIEKMLWGLPWFHFEVPPPLQHEPLVASLPTIYHCEGLILPSEIGMYIGLVRSQRDLPLQQLSNQGRVSFGKLESGGNAHLRLYDLLGLDDCLEQRGELVELYWWEISSRLRLERTWSTLPSQAMYSTGAKHALVSLLVSVGRWLQYIYQADPDWLAAIRRGIGMAGPQAIRAGAR